MITQFNNEYKWLSNFAPCKIIINGIIYQSVEHAYQSEKSLDIEWKNLCSSKDISAGQIKKYSHSLTTIRDDWNDIRVDVMRNCINQKFSQEPYYSLLIATGEEYIQEGNWWGDKFWGVDIKTNNGGNVLGFLIMEERKKLNDIS